MWIVPTILFSLVAFCGGITFSDSDWLKENSGWECTIIDYPRELGEVSKCEQWTLKQGAIQ